MSVFEPVIVRTICTEVGLLLSMERPIDAMKSIDMLVRILEEQKRLLEERNWPLPSEASRKEWEREMSNWP